MRTIAFYDIGVPLLTLNPFHNTEEDISTFLINVVVHTGVSTILAANPKSK